MRSGQERCFRARAHDRVGRVSHYGDQRCFLAPVDDRSFTSHGGVRRHAGWAIGGTVTALGAHGQSLVRHGLVGRELLVHVHTSDGFCPRVWWGHQMVMGHSCGEWGSWYYVELSRLHRGPVRIEGGEADASALVDAVAAARVPVF